MQRRWLNLARLITQTSTSLRVYELRIPDVVVGHTSTHSGSYLVDSFIHSSLISAKFSASGSPRTAPYQKYAKHLYPGFSTNDLPVDGHLSGWDGLSQIICSPPESSNRQILPLSAGTRLQEALKPSLGKLKHHISCAIKNRPATPPASTSYLGPVPYLDHHRSTRDILCTSSVVRWE